MLDGERRCLDTNSRFRSTIKLHVHNPSPQATMNEQSEGAIYYLPWQKRTAIETT